MAFRLLTFDAKKTLKGKFKPSTSAEREFYKQLRKVAQASGHMIEQHVDGARLTNDRELQAALKAYSKKLEPWAARQSAKLLQTVKNSNKRAYAQKSKAIGLGLKLGLGDEDVERLSLALMQEQVALITSIPLEAGMRAQRIAYEAMTKGVRAQATASEIDDLAEELGLSTEVAESRALLIARTETARATAAINQARADAAGSVQYRWHNSGDEAVRESHRIYKGRRLQGMIFTWDQPPTLSDGMTGHPGTFPNCRCFAEPIFNDE